MNWETQYSETPSAIFRTKLTNMLQNIDKLSSGAKFLTNKKDRARQIDNTAGKTDKLTEWWRYRQIERKFAMYHSNNREIDQNKEGLNPG